MNVDTPFGGHGPLAGVRILEAATIFAAPFAAALLGDLGAEVTKIEMPGAGDPMRAMQPLEAGQPLIWASIARNKRSVTLDLRVEEGRALFLKLVAGHDVLIENFRPGTLDRWGLDIDTLRSANPRLVVSRVSGYGQTGPRSHLPGFGTPATAFSGYAHSTGFPDREPVLPPISLIDYVAGLFTAFGTVTALYHRDALGGAAQEVDVALYESILRFLEGMITQYDRLGVVPQRQGNQFTQSVPCGLFQASDEVWLVLSTSSDKTFGRLARLMGREDMLADPRYATNADRVDHRELVNAIVTDWFGSRPGADIQKLCDEAGVPVNRVNSMADVFADDHVQKRQSLVEVDHPALGSITMPAVVPRFSDTPGEVRTVGPDLGEHTRTVLSDLGLAESEIDRLATAGVI